VASRTPTPNVTESSFTFRRIASSELINAVGGIENLKLGVRRSAFGVLPKAERREPNADPHTMP
jgi:hypothetical protein